MQTRYGGRTVNQTDHPYLTAAMAVILLLTVQALPLLAAEPVTLIVEGIEGEVLKNVQEALVLPPGLVRDGIVDRLWLERFRKQAIEAARTAMEPYGYYDARIAVAIEEEVPGEYRLRVKVEPGEPVRVAEVGLALQGPGAEEGAAEGAGGRLPAEEGRRPSPAAI